jgi:hypothetical protein
MAARKLIATGAAFAAVVLHADAPASAQLHFLLLADTLLIPTVDSLNSATPASAKVPFSLGPQGQLLSGPFASPHPAEDRVTEFFRTGILIGDDHSDHPIKKLSVGPCEGGQLLNLRTSW